MSSIKETEKKATSNRPSWRLYAGLGNPGDAYANTYHNVGRQCLDALWVSADVIAWKTVKGKPFLLAQKDGVNYCLLTGYMNASGVALKAACAYCNVSLGDVLVFHDDSDMPVGKFKIVSDQRSAGHKGVQSIIDAFGTQNFWRCKIGIRPATEVVRQKAEEFVLKKIKREDQTILTQTFDRIAKEIRNRE
ncbi:MAG: aminoacyl-tRNA hydrolase [Candidatus Paceibacterota bacterium]|jgi:PTH1 family peptidyl-tRNA hydrolase